MRKFKDTPETRYKPLRRRPTGCISAIVAVSATVFFAASAAATPPPGDVHIEARPLLTTYGDPSDYVTSPGEYDGVVELVVTGEDGSSRGTGSLISDRYILTAAHVLDTTDDGNADVTAENIQITFELAESTDTDELEESTKVYGAVSRDIHSQYDPDS
ncbi:MAG: trypsin-like serine protease, partial [Phycisphaerae bacterium]